MVLDPDEEIVMDMEAGVEHLGRGTIASVDHLLVVVQPYRGSLETAMKITRLAGELGIASPHIVVNQAADKADIDYVEKALGVAVAAAFPPSGKVKEAERVGGAILDSDPHFLEIAKGLISYLEASR